MFLHLCVILVTGEGGLCPGGGTPYGNVRAVRILLKCILVKFYIFCLSPQKLYLVGLLLALTYVDLN